MMEVAATSLHQFPYLVKLSVGVLVSVLLEHLALGLHPIGFLSVQFGVVGGTVHVPDVLLEVDDAVL